MRQSTNELSRPVSLAALGLDPVVQEVVATDPECAALARRAGLPAVNSLHGRVSVVREPGRIIRATGELTASVRQTCVVTLEPFDQAIEEAFTLYFTDAPGAGTAGELDVALEDDEAPEPVDGDLIDCGEIVAQQLLLALDPFPRSPEAEAVGAADRTEPEPAADNPFRALEGKIR